MFVMALLAPLLLCACAAARFKEPIGTFDKAVDATVSSTKTLQQKYLEGNPLISATATNGQAVCWTVECATGKTDCRLFQISAAPAKPVAGIEGVTCQGIDLNSLAEPSDGDKEILDVLKNVDEYANGLAKLAAADSAGDLDKAIGSLDNSLKALGESAKFDQDFSPFTAIINFVGGTYLEWRRNKAMKVAIESADPAIQAMPSLVGEKLVSRYRDALIQEASRKVTVTKIQYDRQRAARNPKSDVDAALRIETLHELSDRVAALQTVKKLNTQELFAKMAKAHYELLQTARSSDIDISFDALKEFASSAKDTYESVQKI